MKYFIRSSCLSHDTALAGMPYPSQGLVLGGEGLVEKLWANSPIDKAGVQLGDMVWSLEKNTRLAGTEIFRDGFAIPYARRACAFYRFTRGA
jgi:hypothetical protein